MRRRHAGGSEVTMLESIALGAGLSWGSGLRLYLTVFCAGMAARLGWLHLPPSLEPEIRQRLGDLAREGAPAARIADPFSLGSGVAYRIDSPELEHRRAWLADLWADVLTPQDRAPWRPHVTIQNKVEPAEARALLDRLKADFRPRPLAIAGFASWYYRGGPWEKLSRHMVA